MHPEIFEIPFIHATVKSYGLMIVIGLLATIFVVRKLSDRIGLAAVNKENITNGALLRPHRRRYRCTALLCHSLFRYIPR